MAEESNDYVKKMAEKLEKDASYLWDQYNTPQEAMSAAMKGAMSWVPGFIKGKQGPSVAQMLSLASHLVVAAAGTQMVYEKSQRKIGFTS